MKLYLFNLTDESLSVGCFEHAGKLSVLPNAFTALPASKDNFILLSSTVVNSEIKYEKASRGVEVVRQHVVNLKESSRRSPGHVSMPEGCPWRIYRDQVASSILL
jgi:hypothetical protein